MYVNYLTATERQSLLVLLSEQAPDYILLRAAESTVDERIQMRIDLTEINKATKKVPIPASTKTTVIAPTATANNVEPPGEAASRITPASRDALIARLRESPATAAVVAQSLKSKADNVSRLLKLLWTRNEVTFDGVRFNVGGV